MDALKLDNIKVAVQEPALGGSYVTSEQRADFLMKLRYLGLWGDVIESRRMVGKEARIEFFMRDAEVRDIVSRQKLQETVIGMLVTKALDYFKTMGNLQYVLIICGDPIQGISRNTGENGFVFLFTINYLIAGPFNDE